MVLGFWETIERCITGLRMDETKFNMKIFNTVTTLADEYGFEYDPETVIPTDNQLVDEYFEAGVKAAVELGVYSRDTKRNVRFTEEEIGEFLRAATGELSGLGEGKYEVKAVQRKVGSTAEPYFSGAPQTQIYSTPEVADKVYRISAKERSADGCEGGLVINLDGKYDIRPNHPSEIYQYRREVERLRKAVAAAGKPGMFIVINAPTAQATIAMADREFGIRPTDPLGGNLFEELKIDWNFANRTAFAIAYGTRPRGSAGHAFVGGFSGGPATAPIVIIAGALLGLFFSGADIEHIKRYGVHASVGATHNRIKSRAVRSLMYVRSMALQALVRNTRLPVCGQGCDHPVAGAGTDQFFHESAAGDVQAVVSGAVGKGASARSFVSLVDCGTPLESKWVGEVVKSSAGMSRENGREIILALLERYEDKLEEGYPEGHTFQQMYDLEKEELKPEFQRFYTRMKEELEDLGMKFKERYA